MRVVIEFQPITKLPVDASALLPETILTLAQKQIENLFISIGNRQVELGECSHVIHAVDEPDELILSGATDNLANVGWKMKTGRLRVEHNVGRCAGMEMAGGELVINGNADDYLGCNLQGGLIHVLGSTGNHCGAGLPGQKTGMNGGIILVGVNAGNETGTHMRRGLIVIGKDCGEFAAADMRAGTIIVKGECGKYTGLGMQRGSLVAGCLQGPLLAGFRTAGQADTEWLRLYFRKLNSLGVQLPDGWMSNGWPRFTGDRMSLGKGEVLVHDPFE